VSENFLKSLLKTTGKITQYAAQAQNSVIKNNVLNYLHGREVDGIYDGYSYMALYVGESYSTNFQHLHDFEPASMNHYVLHHDIFSKFYFGRMQKNFEGDAEKYSSYTKNKGPPLYTISAQYDALEHHEYLQSHSIP
jgi:hypothetical protein